MSVVSLSMSVLSLPRPYLPEFGSLAILLNCLVAKPYRVNVGTFGQCRYNRTLSYFIDNFSATLVVIAMCNPDKSQ